MTELAYGHGLRGVPEPRVTLRDANLLPDLGYAEALLQLADRAIKHDEAYHESSLDRLLFAVCWARFDLTVAGQAARASVCLHMDRSDVRYAVAQELFHLLGRDNAGLADIVTERIVRGLIDVPYSTVEDDKTGVS